MIEKITDIGKVESIKKIKKQQKPDVSSKPVAMPEDSVSISNEAQTIANRKSAFKVALNALRDIPEIRADRVETAKQRVAEGYYDRPDVINDLAEKLSTSNII